MSLILVIGIPKLSFFRTLAAKSQLVTQYRNGGKHKKIQITEIGKQIPRTPDKKLSLQ
jgi:hypothetical protein